jgi:hypothetical protein
VDGLEKGAGAKGTATDSGKGVEEATGVGVEVGLPNWLNNHAPPNPVTPNPPNKNTRRVTTQGKNLEDEQCQQREVLKNRGEKCPAF